MNRGQPCPLRHEQNAEQSHDGRSDGRAGDDRPLRHPRVARAQVLPGQRPRGRADRKARHEAERFPLHRDDVRALQAAALTCRAISICPMKMSTNRFTPHMAMPSKKLGMPTRMMRLTIAPSSAMAGPSSRRSFTPRSSTHCVTPPHTWLNAVPDRDAHHVQVERERIGEHVPAEAQVHARERPRERHVDDVHFHGDQRRLGGLARAVQAHRAHHHEPRKRHRQRDHVDVLRAEQRSLRP